MPNDTRYTDEQDRRDRLRRVSELLNEWASDESGFDDRVEPQIDRFLRETAPRLFPEQERPEMPSERHYTDEQVEKKIAMLGPHNYQEDTAAMLRALLADRRRLERENSIAADILNVVSDAVEAGAIEEVYLSLLRDKIAAVESWLGREVTG